MLTVGKDTYVTVEEADAYIERTYLSADERRMAWEALSEEDKEVHLRRSAMAIERLPYPGVKCEEGQVMAFPRHNDWGKSGVCAVPKPVKFAQVEEAFEYAAPSADTATHADVMAGVKSKSYDRYSVSYAAEDKAMAGIIDKALISSRAKQCLLPQTRGSYRVW